MSSSRPCGGGGKRLRQPSPARQTPQTPTDSSRGSSAPFYPPRHTRSGRHSLLHPRRGSTLPPLGASPSENSGCGLNLSPTWHFAKRKRWVGVDLSPIGHQPWLRKCLEIKFRSTHRGGRQNLDNMIVYIQIHSYPKVLHSNRCSYCVFSS